MHPHGLLPLGAILNGLTWAGGGLRGITASGAELPEPAAWTQSTRQFGGTAHGKFRNYDKNGNNTCIMYQYKQNN